MDCWRFVLIIVIFGSFEAYCESSPKHNDYELLQKNIDLQNEQIVRLNRQIALQNEHIGKLQQAVNELKESIGKLQEEPVESDNKSVTTESRESVASFPATTRNENLQFANVIKRLEKKISDQEKLALQLGISKPRNCEEIRLKDSTKESGMYWIDPDGHGIGDDPIHVFCNMTTGTTFISHNSEETIEVNPCIEPGCYSHSVVYNASMKQMIALVQRSTECRQFIQYDCFVAPFKFNGVSQSWWYDKNGVSQFYWAGSNASTHMCQCGIDGNCVDRTLPCNCDSFFPADLTDSGFIANKTALPITKLKFGRIFAPATTGQHRLGKLECSGFESFQQVPTSCEDLKREGHSLNGIYAVKEKNGIESVFCDMGKLPGDIGLQTLIGGTSGFKLYFSVKSQPGNTTSSYITFNMEETNIGNSMDIKSGEFKAPVYGVYLFSFIGKTREYSQVFLRKNGLDITSATSNAGEYISFSSILVLKLGDQIKIRHRHPYGHDLVNFPSTFTCVLLNEISNPDR